MHQLAASERPTGPRAGPVFFKEIVDRAGIDFVLKNSVTDHKFLIETMIGGVAVLDYDDDGLLDVYSANGALIPAQQRGGLTLGSGAGGGPEAFVIGGRATRVAGARGATA